MKLRKKNFWKPITVKGIKQKFKKASEMKFHDSVNPPLSSLPIPSNATEVVWDCNGWIFDVPPPGAGATRCITTLGQGSGFAQYTGFQINARYAAVKIRLDQNPDATVAEEALRIMILKPVNGGYQNGLNYPPLPTSVMDFIRPDWYVMFDKLYTWKTGYTINSQFNLGVIQRYMKFTIPLKATLSPVRPGNESINNPVGSVLWEKPCIIAMITQQGNIRVREMVTRFYYQDP